MHNFVCRHVCECVHKHWCKWANLCICTLSGWTMYIQRCVYRCRHIPLSLSLSFSVCVCVCVCVCVGLLICHANANHAQCYPESMLLPLCKLPHPPPILGVEEQASAP